MLTGLAISWCGTGVNSPILSEIVPKQHRSIVFALDRTFEGAVAAVAPAIVGVLAVDVFGWSGGRSTCNAEDANALGSALFYTILVTWLGCFMFYSLLHCTYPRDRRRAAQAAEGWGELPGDGGDHDMRVGSAGDLEFSVINVGSLREIGALDDVDDDVDRKQQPPVGGDAAREKVQAVLADDDDDDDDD